MNDDRFLIVDGNSIACRAFYGNQKGNTELCTTDGYDTGTTHRFLHMFNLILFKSKPTHVLIAWDKGGDTFRNKISPIYKANRIKTEHKERIPFFDIKHILESIGIKNVAIDGYEGDDIVGTYAKLSEAEKNFIVTGDKDAFQLVNEKTAVIFPLTNLNNVAIVTKKYIKEKYDIEVEQFIDYKMLIGDKSDNIIGVNGCGDKTAVKLLNKYGTINNILKNVDNLDIEGVSQKKIGSGLTKWAITEPINRKLVTIVIDVPVPYTYNDCKLNIRWDMAKNKLQELELNQIMGKIEEGDFFNGE